MCGIATASHRAGQPVEVCSGETRDCLLYFRIVREIEETVSVGNGFPGIKNFYMNEMSDCCGYANKIYNGIACALL
jgi:hypothetical protein